MREKAVAQRRVLSAREEETGRADAPSPHSPSGGGIRAAGELGDKTGRAFGSREKARVPTGNFLPQGSKRSLGHMRLKLIPLETPPTKLNPSGNHCFHS